MFEDDLILCEVLFTLVFVALFKMGALGCADTGGKYSQLSVYYNNTVTSFGHKLPFLLLSNISTPEYYFMKGMC